MQQNGFCQKIYWRPNNIEDMEFLEATLRDYSFALHVHDAFTVTLVVKGALNLYFQTGEFVLRPGMLFLIGSQVPQGIKKMGRGEYCLYRTLLFGEEFVKKHFPGFGEEHRRAITLISSPKFYKKFNDAFSEKHFPLNIDLESCTNLLEQIFSRMDNGITLEKLSLSKDINTITNFIDQNILYSLDVHKLSQIFCFSYSHFIRKFKSEMGITPNTYLIQKKIIKARKRLAEGESMLSIAHALGFCDQSHFSNTFKKMLGVSPTHYVNKDKT